MSSHDPDPDAAGPADAGDPAASARADDALREDLEAVARVLLGADAPGDEPVAEEPDPVAEEADGDPRAEEQRRQRVLNELRFLDE